MSTSPASALDAPALRAFVENRWEDDIVPELETYIRIPNLSPMFDPDWAQHGHMERAVTHIAGWCERQAIEGLSLEVVRLEGRTPLIYMEIPATDGSNDPSDDTVLLYGHLDKQPEMVGWRDDLGPWKPVRERDLLYGRGGADDGYAAYASLTAIEAVRRHGGSHTRCVVLIEACEESGSYDLPPYIEALRERIGEPSLVVCLDSGCGTYDRLWLTTSLRGIVVGTLDVGILSEGVHSGDASGVVPSSFRIARMLLDRIEDPATGDVHAEALRCEVPTPRRTQAEQAGAVLGDTTWTKFPFVDGAHGTSSDPTDLVLARTWHAALSVTGCAGLPPLESAGNVLRPSTSLKLSLRVPPTMDSHAASLALKELLERDPPYGAQVRFIPETPGDGWLAPDIAPWLEAACDEASETYFGQASAKMGEGGSIPFMGMLGALFPRAQFLITGVLGPASNAHGPNEFLHIPMGKRVTACVAHVLDRHADRTA